MYSTKVWEQAEEKGGNTGAYVPLLECEEVKEAGAGRVQISLSFLLVSGGKPK